MHNTKTLWARRARTSFTPSAGSDIARWRATPSAHILFVQTQWRVAGWTRKPCATAIEEHSNSCRDSRTSGGLVLHSGATSRVDKAGSVSRRGHFGRCSMSGSYTLAKHKVVWKDQAADFAAAVMPIDDSIPPQTTRSSLLRARVRTKPTILRRSQLNAGSPVRSRVCRRDANLHSHGQVHPRAQVRFVERGAWKGRRGFRFRPHRGC